MQRSLLSATMLYLMVVACSPGMVEKGQVPAPNACPDPLLQPITSAAEFERSYFDRDGRLGEPACVSPDLVGRIQGVDASVGAIKQRFPGRDGQARLGVPGQDVNFLFDHKALEKILLTGPPKNYTGLFWRNGFAVVEQIGFPAAFASSQSGASQVYQLVVFKRPQDSSVLLGYWDNAFKFLELAYGDRAPVITEQVRNIIKSTPFASPDGAGGRQASLSGCGIEPLSGVCQFGCPSFFTLRADSCSPHWNAAVDFVQNVIPSESGLAPDPKCSIDASGEIRREDCSQVVDHFLSGGPYSCNPGDAPQACQGALRVRAFFLLVNDFNPVYTGNGYTATGYANLLSPTNNEFFIPNHTAQELEQLSGEPLALIYFCINGKRLNYPPADTDTCQCQNIDQLGFCTVP